MSRELIHHPGQTAHSVTVVQPNSHCSRRGPSPWLFAIDDSKTVELTVQVMGAGAGASTGSKQSSLRVTLTVRWHLLHVPPTNGIHDCFFHLASTSNRLLYLGKAACRTKYSYEVPGKRQTRSDGHDVTFLLWIKRKTAGDKGADWVPSSPGLHIQQSGPGNRFLSLQDPRRDPG